MDNSIKFVWNGIKINGTLYKGSYSTGPYTNESGLPQDTVSIYMNRSNTPRLPELEVTNDSDIMTDYFENDTVYVRPSSKYFEAAQRAANAYDIHYAKKSVKYAEEAFARHLGTQNESLYRQDLEQRREKLAQLEAKFPNKKRSELCI